MTIATFEQILSSALNLTPKERLQLIERLASSLEHDVQEPSAQPLEDEHWGRRLNRLLDELDTEQWSTSDMDDPVEWLQKLREEQRARRLGDWGAE
jgi:hypothetical protein